MSGEVRVRDATPADAFGVARLVAAAFAPYVPRIGRRPAPMDEDYPTVIRAGRVRVAYLEASPHAPRVDPSQPPAAECFAGMLAWTAHHRHIEVAVLAVAPSARGQGIGARLLADAERVAGLFGVAELRLCTNVAMTENLSYYPRHGFHEVGRGQEQGFHRVFYAKTLR